MNKTEIIQKIKQLESLTHDERAYIVELVNTKKKYGLVWEDKPEDVEDQLRTQLPVLREVVERRIEAQPEASPNPFYVVIQIFGVLFFDNFLFHFTINLFTTN